MARRARIAHAGRAVWATVSEDGTALALAGGGSVAADEAQWLPPVTPGASIYALGLNYADHNRELGFAAKQAKPLVFLKGGNALVGHGGTTPRPADANQMHPECELVAVIGRPARNVSEAEALDYVSGYTVANDYAIREYLENYYRPNARVKNRDATTALGPWIVDAADVPNPQALSLSTTVNGQEVQHGSTADMILSVAGLVEYLSGILTLMPGDLILTGTPHGVHFCAAGDEVVTEISGIGRLVNRLEAA
ncbi:5-oxopent-3-ene-1,2,5-tricarboxylate decarboxylase/2-hydroxyhepta-2,4-diene-1,7-dioate isomerase [Novosphingobium chloroacetimidivorans]|uniref:5-oxopent-3-ene-1,2,5-tricarboxylate decarboxylase/2-hydroxyhepta-2,4-diene-1,7-dioate isomerase n=1 Tax=Novosphingobium chloroacetimidivorans TaxID=1428314 RepID=A0A7W7KAK8_9SPHN|nr:fumarylacetoacetate hydrolase family protein [Novosphingobium chloroacetimidivorans]MBB4858643.1 5-oxopent-3-ene-1,2,5-tricarboxylate decarboxylase/2-hydroxyhepta-2,4-diene-1,7-dioate isomerase [Novosphingobium chloroacetimidivorans]